MQILAIYRLPPLNAAPKLRIALEPRIDGSLVLTHHMTTVGRLVVIAMAVLAIAACAAQKRAKRPAPVSAPARANADSGPPPQISACREYADTMAGRQMQQDFDSIQGNFEGGSSQVFQDFARMDAQRYYRQLYESCLSQHRGPTEESTSR